MFVVHSCTRARIILQLRWGCGISGSKAGLQAPLHGAAGVMAHWHGRTRWRSAHADATFFNVSTNEKACTCPAVLYGILGIRVQWRGTENLPEGRHVVVSNHVTVGDLMVLYARPQPYVHLITSRLPRRITQVCRDPPLSPPPPPPLSPHTYMRPETYPSDALIPSASICAMGYQLAACS